MSDAASSADAADTSVQSPEQVKSELSQQHESKPSEQRKPTVDDLPPEALNQRLERERRKILSDLGVENVDDVKKALAEYKAAQDAKKAESELWAEKLAAYEKQVAQLSALQSVVSERARYELEQLTDEQRAAVRALSGDDEAAALRAITALRPTWQRGEQVAQPSTVPEPLSTSAKASAPADTTHSPPDRRAEWESLKRTNPVAAANYLLRHRTEIFPSQST